MLLNDIFCYCHSHFGSGWCKDNNVYGCDAIMCCIVKNDVTSCYGMLQIVVCCYEVKCVAVCCCMTSVAVVICIVDVSCGS